MADTIPTLSISLEKVCFIVIKARKFDVKDVLTDEDDGSNAADDGQGLDPQRADIGIMRQLVQ